METATPSDDKTETSTTVHHPHILTGISEDEGPSVPPVEGPSESSADEGPSVPSVVPPEPSSPPPSSPPIEEGDGKYICKLGRKKSSIRRKRVLAAVTAVDNKPVHIPLVEYGDLHDQYDLIAERVMHGHDVTLGIRTLKEKLGMLTAIRGACEHKIDVRLAKEEKVRRRIQIKRSLVVWTFGFIFLSVLMVFLKILFIGARAYYGLIKDHIHQFRAT